MDTHKNARLTPKGREAMIRAVVDEGLTKTDAAQRFNTTSKTVRKWVERFQALGAAFLLSTGAFASAQDAVGQFYQGKTVTVVIGSAPGGGYDTFGRLLARYLGRHMFGNPTVLPRNMPGASSYLAANYMFAIAPRDGTTIAAVTAGALLQPLFGRNAQTGLGGYD
jgi:leucine-zipper of insertion element IS481